MKHFCLIKLGRCDPDRLGRDTMLPMWVYVRIYQVLPSNRFVSYPRFSVPDVYGRLSLCSRLHLLGGEPETPG